MKKLKVFGYAWHVPHQYEIAKLPFIGEYHLVHNPFKKWDESGSPLPENVKFVPYFDPAENYDLAILHFDQQCIQDRIGKGRIIKDLIEVLPYNLPKVVINHQTPFLDKMPVQDVINKTRELIGHIPMVVNSKEAATQWGWGNPIIHGLTASEWFDLPKEPRVVTVLTPAGMEQAYKREFIMQVREMVQEAGIIFCWIGVDVGRFDTKDEYKEYIGRSLVYFQGTHNSPMPRSRTEAMLSGACIVTTKYHDADSFIEDKVNGFLVERAPEYGGEDRLLARKAADLLIDLVRNRYKQAIDIGQRGKKTASELFTTEKFQKQWIDFINKTYPKLI